jgi:undecaprenyl-diphosphatase
MSKPSLLSRLSIPLVAGLACAAASLVLFTVLANEMREGELLHFDTTIRIFVHAHSSPPLTQLMRFFSLVGSPFVVTIGATTTSIALWVAGHRRRALLIAITTLGGTLLMVVMKLGFHRQRPQPFFDTQLPASYSFPSGHALLSFCLCGAAAALFAANQKSAWVRVAIWVAAAGLSGAIGYSRIYLGVHYPSDVVAGYLAALAWVLGVAAAYQKWRKPPGSETPSMNVR